MTDSTESWFHPSFGLLLTGTLAALWVCRRWSVRRALQVWSSSLFVALLWLAAFDGRPHWPVDLFLFTDPLLAIVHTLAGRAVVGLLAISLGFVVLAAVMGRLFCSHLCPLGALLDVTDRVVARRTRAGSNRDDWRRLRGGKYLLLVVMLAAACLGCSLLGWADPLVLLTRIAATLLHPLLLTLERWGVGAADRVGEWLEWPRLGVGGGEPRVFEGMLGTLVLLLILVLPSRLQPRFWCRNLCPLGGLLALVGWRARYRRRVSDACNACGICAARCPMGAIDASTGAHDRSECIACRSCVDRCRRGATSFGFGDGAERGARSEVSLSRRVFVSGAVGGVAAGIALRGPGWLARPEDGTPAAVRAGLIRPPGALPELEFLSRCARCGECLKVCPTNTLQPDWYRAGLDGLWAPRLQLRHGWCRQDCNACGQVCPTEAIRPLSLEEKRHARVGTATILPDRCRAWAEDRSCFVCEAQCPYGAVSLRYRSGHRAHVPMVEAARCNGCGRCEQRCPADGGAAIVVEARGELRLAEGSYREAARAAGLVFEPPLGTGRGRFHFTDDSLPRGLR